MNRFRLLLLAVGAVVLLFVVAGAVLFSSSFQTWAARKAIASRPALRASVGELSAGMKRIGARDLRFEQDGAVLTLPSIEADLPVISAAMGKKVIVSRLVAKGWRLDLSKTSAASSARSDSAATPTGAGTTNANASTAPAVAAAQSAFAGIFGQLQLPVDLALDGVQLEGEVVLPGARGRVKISLNGGNLGAGKEGRFDLAAQAMLTDPAIHAVDLRGGITAAMDTPRSFTRLAAKFDAAASGAQFPKEVKLSSDLAATRAATGETYALAIVSAGQEILQLNASLPRNAPKLDGTWRIDVRDADIAPFALGQPLPAFTAVGDGAFDTDAAFSTVHVVGRLNATADRLQALRPEFAVLGELALSGEFDLAEKGGTIDVKKFQAAIAAAQPIATVRSLQAFEFTPKTRTLRAADPGQELLGVALHGVPVSWAEPFIEGLDLSGGHVRGELAGRASDGGVTLRSTTPLTVDALTLAQDGKALVERVDVSLNASVDYTPRGWQTEIGEFTAKSGGATLLALAAKAGQLAGKDQPLKSTGKITAHLPALLLQPVAAGSLILTSGDATMEFVASLNAKKEIHAKVALPNLTTGAEAKRITLPAIAAEIRSDIAADGKITFSAPILIERNARKSDLTIAGSISAEKDKARAIDAQVTSTQLVLDDVQVLAALAPGKPDKKSDAKSPPDPKIPPDGAPPWAGLHGTVSLLLKKVIYSDAFEANDVAGRLRMDAGTVKLEGLQAGLGANGRASLSGTVTFDASNPQPYTLAADLALKEFDPGPLFRAISPGQPATVEGKFDVASKLSSRGASLGDLTLGAGGQFHLTSKGGVFRGLPVNVGNLVENSGKLAGWIASAGTAIGSITGKKDYADVANKAQAMAEFAKGMSAVAYDQLSIVLARDAGLNTTLKDFTLISPEVRLTGSGTALHRPGSSLLEDALAMEFKLRARGRQGDLLRYLGMLETQSDDFGYAACTVPLKVGGTLAKVDTSELNSKLVGIALEKSGVTDKAADLVNRLFGGGK